ncbi:MAG: ABC transporter ATP-binding protein [Planctomycetota bacterium]|nr:ABC transporter ATP-binding protein [Planctomycetota bacterium]MDA0920286.1 ABC transporter ATP-binding protein [Planctomycetota bacterium]
MSAPAIEIDNLVVRFGRFTAVNDLSLTVNEGELFGFLGPNGAGKTTTIKVLIGSQRPTSGTIRVAGFQIPAEFDQVKQQFGYVPDTENHIEEFTGRENLELFARLYDMPLSTVDESLARLELSEAADVVVSAYSKGMRRKLLIAREIMHRPKILYFDEPTANLDAHSTELVRELLRDLTSQGTTIFLTTHNMEEVEQICDRVAILCRGELVDYDTPTNFVTRHAVRIVKAQFEREGNVIRESLDLDLDDQRERLAEIIRHEKCVRVHSQEFDFQDVFLKITGQAYT